MNAITKTSMFSAQVNTGDGDGIEQQVCFLSTASISLCITFPMKVQCIGFRGTTIALERAFLLFYAKVAA